MRFCWAVALGVALRGVGMTALAQSAAPPPAPTSGDKPYVLHVYANLVQVPVLALNTDFKPLPPLVTSSVNLSLDSGPVFHPTKMHIEGEEPISIGIVLDASGDQDRLLRKLADSAESMAMASLREHDHVTLFAVDCKIVRSGLYLPVEPHTLHTAVDHALLAPSLHNGQDHGSCEHSLHLWDAVGLALEDLILQPGRKMLLVISDGEDRKSSTSWNRLRNFADDHSIAIFGLRDLDRFVGDFNMQRMAGTQHTPREAGVYYGEKDQQEDNYRELCEATGGLVLTTPVVQLTESLERLIAMMRGRYILEFPRADNSSPGRHSIDVTLPGRLAYVVVSGVTVMLPDSASESDPTTIRSAPSPAVMGKRRMLSPQ